MKRFFSIPIVVVFLSGLISGVCAAPAEKPIELRVSHMNPAGSPGTSITIAGQKR